MQVTKVLIIVNVGQPQRMITAVLGKTYDIIMFTVVSVTTTTF